MIALAGLVDAGFSGDWQARGYLSDAAAETARGACFAAAAAHVVLTGAAGFIARAKGEGLASAAVTLAVRREQTTELCCGHARAAKPAHRVTLLGFAFACLPGHESTALGRGSTNRTRMFRRGSGFCLSPGEVKLSKEAVRENVDCALHSPLGRHRYRQEEGCGCRQVPTWL